MLRQAARAIAGLASPDPVKRVRTLEMIAENLLWRAGQEAAYRHLEVPPALPASAVRGALLYATRELMLDAVPKACEVAEVGTWRGEFSARIVETCRPRVFHLIDIDLSPLDPSVQGIRHQGDSSTILAGFPAASLDWVYIDGDHSYEGARKDLAAAHRALKPGARMTCNDYTNWMSLAVQPYGVARAVNEFVVERGYKVEGLALSRFGNHDLLIRRPD